MRTRTTFFVGLSVLLCLFLAPWPARAGGRIPLILYRGSAQGRVVFDHQTHASKGLRCNDCHTDFDHTGRALFFTRKQGLITFEDHHTATKCFACHNGEGAAVKNAPYDGRGAFNDCQGCHRTTNRWSFLHVVAFSAPNPSGIRFTTNLIWLPIIAGLFFIAGHALYVAFVAGPKEFVKSEPLMAASSIPEQVPRHSLAARMFHWIMAASILVLFTAFLPKVGVPFDWTLYHGIAGIVLTVCILFHFIHSSFFLDFRSIWPDKTDLRDAMHRTFRFLRKPAPAPAKFAKYPLENKLYHLGVMLTGLTVIGTGLFMMKRVHTIFFSRTPYLFTDTAWGFMYVLHGLAIVCLVALVMVHAYMGIRLEKLPITKSMIFGWMSRAFYLEEHDPKRWAIKQPMPSQKKQASAATDADRH